MFVHGSGGPPDRLLTERDVATLTGLSVHFFQRLRWRGGGPPFVKFERAVRYKESDLRAWIDVHAGRRSTSDHGPSRRDARASPDASHNTTPGAHQQDAVAFGTN